MVYVIEATPDGTAVVRPNGDRALFLGEGAEYASSRDEAAEVIRLLKSGQATEGDYDWISPDDLPQSPFSGDE